MMHTNDIFNILKYNKTLRSYTSIKETYIFYTNTINKYKMFDDSLCENSINNLKIYNNTLNTIIINFKKFTNDNNQIKLDFHYFNINFIYL